MVDRRILAVVPMDWTWHMIFFTIFVPCVFDVLLWVYGTYLPTIIVVSAYIIFLTYYCTCSSLLNVV